MKHGGAPAPNPCGSCPYRRDVPSGVWHREEYEKLPPYDNVETAQQPPKAFFCHQQDGRLCSGWAAVHDMENSLGLRLAIATGHVTAEAAGRAVLHRTTVPLFSSGAEAAAHGMKDIERPRPAARRVVEKLKRRRRARAT